jgi:hypothetical protein
MRRRADLVVEFGLGGPIRSLPDREPQFATEGLYRARLFAVRARSPGYLPSKRVACGLYPAKPVAMGGPLGECPRFSCVGVLEAQARRPDEKRMALPFNETSGARDPRALTILAKTIYRELRASGYEERDVMGLASELLGIVASEVKGRRTSKKTEA